MKIEILKVHKIYEDVFEVGDITHMVKSEKGKWVVLSKKNKTFYLAEEMAKAFSNKCSYSDLFKKIS